jgi:hypothetical protein
MSTLKNNIDLLAIAIIFSRLPDDWNHEMAVRSAVTSYYELAGEYWDREYKTLKALGKEK